MHEDEQGAGRVAIKVTASSQNNGWSAQMAVAEMDAMKAHSRRWQPRSATQTISTVDGRLRQQRTGR